jgi:hypothetical protein
MTQIYRYESVSFCYEEIDFIRGEEIVSPATYWQYKQVMAFEQWKYRHTRSVGSVKETERQILMTNSDNS